MDEEEKEKALGKFLDSIYAMFLAEAQ